jgi:hypothetical protein
MIVNLFLVTVHLVHFDHNTSNPAHFVLEISKSPRTSMMKRREEKGLWALKKHISPGAVRHFVSLLCTCFGKWRIRHTPYQEIVILSMG